MPIYRSINLVLHSQFDVESFPEFSPRPQEHYNDRMITGTIPPFVNEKTATCSVYIPVLPGSQFWLSYAVLPPVPADQHFLFKLFINGAQIVSWSTSKEQKWKGKTMFGLYEREEEDGRKKLEKRVLCFTPPDKKEGQWADVSDAFDEKAYMEIRVHRAHGRKRVPREAEKFADTAHGINRRGIDLVNAGRADAEQPKRFFKFALIDPSDKPFASFRYYYRTWEQLRELDLLVDDSGESGDETEMSVIEPYDTDGRVFQESKEENSGIKEPKEIEEGVIEYQPVGRFWESRNKANERQHIPISTYVPTGGPLMYRRGESSTEWSHRQQTGRRKPGVNALTTPPSYKLDLPAPSSRPLPTCPQKGIPAVDTSYRPHPAYPVDDWATRTPSPVKSVRDGITTPTLARKKGFTPSGLINVITSSWKRRSTPNSELSVEASDTTSYRSASWSHSC